MRAIYKASISFGLVNVPVKLYSATEEHDLKGHQVHRTDNGRIRYKRVCEACDEAVESHDIAKAYESDNGDVVVTEDDLAALPGAPNRQVEVLEFVSVADLDPLMFDRSYHLGPDNDHTGAVKAYVLLAKTLAQTARVAIVRFTMRDKTHLAALRVVGKGDTLAIHTLRWPDEIREADFPPLHNAPAVSDAELSMAAQIVDSMVNEFNPDRYRDTYQDSLRELVAAKAASGDVSVSPAPAQATEDVSDLLAKLEASVATRQPCKPKTTRRRTKTAAK